MAGVSLAVAHNGAAQALGGGGGVGDGVDGVGGVVGGVFDGGGHNSGRVIVLVVNGDGCGSGASAKTDLLRKPRLLFRRQKRRGGNRRRQTREADGDTHNGGAASVGIPAHRHAMLARHSGGFFPRRGVGVGLSEGRRAEVARGVVNGAAAQHDVLSERHARDVARPHVRLAGLARELQAGVQSVHSGELVGDGVARLAPDVAHLRAHQRAPPVSVHEHDQHHGVVPVAARELRELVGAGALVADRVQSRAVHGAVVAHLHGVGGAKRAAQRRRLA
mmetsp:Transcript_35636/g.87655  ORF Transcript_35636/g.87655 Transcript_35636/m.87655 type:complete len:276 (-) Transcript_35636:688-1515(-)